MRNVILTIVVIIIAAIYVGYVRAESTSPDYASSLVVTKLAKNAWYDLQVAKYNFCPIRFGYEHADAKHLDYWSQKFLAAKSDLEQKQSAYDQLKAQALSLNPSLNESDLQTIAQTVACSY